jgi:hypothetical protein
VGCWQNEHERKAKNKGIIVIRYEFSYSFVHINQVEVG